MPVLAPEEIRSRLRFFVFGFLRDVPRDPKRDEWTRPVLLSDVASASTVQWLTSGDEGVLRDALAAAPDAFELTAERIAIRPTAQLVESAGGLSWSDVDTDESETELVEGETADDDAGDGNAAVEFW